MDLSDPISSVIPSREGQVYHVLARTTAPLSGSRIAELVSKGSNAGVRVVLSRLVMHGTVLATRSGPSILYRANREHLMWPAIEGVSRAADEARGALQDRIAEIVENAVGSHSAAEITLAFFGSVARQESIADSAIDVLAVFPHRLASADTQQIVDDIMRGVERWTGNACNVYSLSDEDLSRLVSRQDPMVSSWDADARTFHGPELRHRAPFTSLKRSSRV